MKRNEMHDMKEIEPIKAVMSEHDLYARSYYYSGCVGM